MPPGPVYFPEGQQSDQPLELLVAELVREQALRLTRDEVPHAIAAEVTSITERRRPPAGRDRGQRHRRDRVAEGHRRRQGRARGQGHRQRRPPRDRGDPRRAGLPRPARQGAQALASGRPLHRAPALALSSPRRLAILAPRSDRNDAARPEAEACKPKNSPRPSTTPCCAPTRRARTSRRSASRRRGTTSPPSACSRTACPWPRTAQAHGRQDVHGHLVPVRRRHAARQGPGGRRGRAARRRRGRRGHQRAPRSSPGSSASCATSSPASCTPCACAACNTGRGQVIVKAIIETCYLDDKIKRLACQICEQAGVDFVKTSTGVGPQGATVQDVELLRDCLDAQHRGQGVGRHPHGGGRRAHGRRRRRQARHQRRRRRS